MGEPQRFLNDGIIVRSAVDMANIQIIFFADIVSDLMHHLPANRKDPHEFLNAAIERWENSTNLPEMNSRQITELETIALIKKAQYHNIIWPLWFGWSNPKISSWIHLKTSNTYYKFISGN